MPSQTALLAVKFKLLVPDEREILGRFVSKPRQLFVKKNLSSPNDTIVKTPNLLNYGKYCSFRGAALTARQNCRTPPKSTSPPNVDSKWPKIPPNSNAPMGMHRPLYFSQESFWIYAASYYDATYIPKLS